MTLTPRLNFLFTFQLIPPKVPSDHWSRVPPEGWHRSSIMLLVSSHHRLTVTERYARIIGSYTPASDKWRLHACGSSWTDWFLPRLSNPKSGCYRMSNTVLPSVVPGLVKILLVDIVRLWYVESPLKKGQFNRSWQENTTTNQWNGYSLILLLGRSCSRILAMRGKRVAMVASYCQWLHNSIYPWLRSLLRCCAQ